MSPSGSNPFLQLAAAVTVYLTRALATSASTNFHVAPLFPASPGSAFAYRNTRTSAAGSGLGAGPGPSTLVAAVLGALTLWYRCRRQRTGPRRFLHRLGWGLCGWALLLTVDSSAQPFKLDSAPADLARWMYSFNASPADRPTASVFAAFGSIPHFDTRDGQFLLGWNTSNSIPTGLGPAQYLIRRARVTLTLSRDLAYTYWGAARDYRTYLPTNDPRYVAPRTPHCPVELFGAGFRGDYTALTFPQDGPFKSGGAMYYTNRNAYAAGFDPHGVCVDVSNNVGDDGTNAIAQPFEVAPFAVGQSANVAAGEPMPAGSRLTFDLNLQDPLIYDYLRRGLNEGGLRFVVSSLVQLDYPAVAAKYPDFYTPFSPLAEPGDYPLIELEGTAVRDVDSDGDGVPDDWERYWFHSLVNHGTADVDQDGASETVEYWAGTDPTDAASAPRAAAFREASGATGLRFVLSASRTHLIQWTDDLRQWHTITNPLLTYRSAWREKNDPNASYPSPVTAEWRDTNAPDRRRFYRLGIE